MAQPPDAVFTGITLEIAHHSFLQSRCGKAWRGFLIENIKLDAFSPKHPRVLMSMELVAPVKLSSLGVVYHTDFKADLNPKTGALLNDCYDIAQAMLRSMKKQIATAEKEQEVRDWIFEHRDVHGFFQWYCAWEKGADCKDCRIIFVAGYNSEQQETLQWPA